MVGLGFFKIPGCCKCPRYVTYGTRRTFQPYLKCSHKCIYCYAQFGFHTRRRKYPKNRMIEKSPNIAVDLRKVSRDYFQLKSYTQIEASSSCDPFDLFWEPKYEITKKALERIFYLRKDIYFIWITKSHLIQNYINLLPKLSICQITIETEHPNITSPNASSLDLRFETIKKLSDAGFPVGVRIDPIIPFWTTQEEIFRIIDKSVSLGCKHITVSTLKMYYQQIKPLEDFFQIHMQERLVKNSKNPFYYFNTIVRKSIELPIKQKCTELGITFATCMEDILSDTGYCDPVHLLKK